MNSSRCSSLVVLLLALGLAVGGAGAVTVSGSDTPADGQVGTDLTATFVLADLYQNPAYETWTLRGETELGNVTWTVQVVDQAGNQIAQPAYDSQTFSHDVSIDSGADELRISVTGTVPPVANYTYDPEESFLLAELTQARSGGTSETIGTYAAHPYTAESREAREAIDDAGAAIEAAGGHEPAQRTLDSAVDAYESGNFALAVDLATQAEESAGQARSAQSRNRLILMAVGALVLVGAVVGGVVYWRNSRTQSRL